jgi:hypothetical protein
VGERGELLPEGEVLQDQRGAAAEGRSESAEEQQDKADHGRRRVGQGGGIVNDRRKYELWRPTARRWTPCHGAPTVYSSAAGGAHVTPG